MTVSQERAIAVATEIATTGTTEAELSEVIEITKFVAGEYVKGLHVGVEAAKSGNPILVFMTQIALDNVTAAGRHLESYLQRMGVDTNEVLFEEHNAMVDAVSEFDSEMAALTNVSPTKDETPAMSDDEFLRSIGIDPYSDYEDDPYYDED